MPNIIDSGPSALFIQLVKRVCKESPMLCIIFLNVTLLSQFSPISVPWYLCKSRSDRILRIDTLLLAAVYTVRITLKVKRRFFGYRCHKSIIVVIRQEMSLDSSLYSGPNLPFWSHFYSLVVPTTELS